MLGRPPALRAAARPPSELETRCELSVTVAGSALEAVRAPPREPRPRSGALLHKMGVDTLSGWRQGLAKIRVLRSFFAGAPPPPRKLKRAKAGAAKPGFCEAAALFDRPPRPPRGVTSKGRLPPAGRCTTAASAGEEGKSDTRRTVGRLRTPAGPFRPRRQGHVAPSPRGRSSAPSLLHRSGVSSGQSIAPPKGLGLGVAAFLFAYPLTGYQREKLKKEKPAPPFPRQRGGGRALCPPPGRKGTPGGSGL